MKNHLRVSISLSLVLVLGVGHLLTAFGQSAPVLNRRNRPTRMIAANSLSHPKTPETLALSKIRASASLLGSRALTDRQISRSASGETTTLLPDGRLLIIGGVGQDGPLPTVTIKDSSTNKTAEIGSGLLHPRAWHTATLLPDGTVLILGGVGADGQVLSNAEIFDPESQRFEALSANGLISRAYHTATLLTEGKVLIAGGISSKGKALNKVELWSFQTRNAVVLPAKVKSARYGHAATLLEDGNVMLSGGMDDEGAMLNDGEVYSCESRRFIRSSESISAERDSNAPRIVASLPDDGAVDVPIDSFAGVRFSKPLRVETVKASAVKLSGPYGIVPSKVIPAEGGMLVFITPKELLLPTTTYTLSLAGLSDTGGLSLSSSVLTFTTAKAVSPVGTVEDEEWKPTANETQGNWQSGRAKSPWQSLPPLEAAPGVTALSGQTLTLNGNPLTNVTLSIGNRKGHTDQTGRFLLTDVTAGHHELLIDGRTASKRKKRYGIFEAGINIEAGKTNTLSYTIWMPLIDTAHAVNISSPTKGYATVSTPSIPGLELHIPANTIIRDHEGNAVTTLSITPIPLDRPPFPLPKDIYVPIYFTIQPGGAYVEVQGNGEAYGNKPYGARLYYPNYRQEAPGTRFDFWHYDPEEKGWYVYGQGAVSEDRKQVVPDKGVQIREFTGAMIALPNTAPGEGPNACNCATDGDPVDLGTGLFVYSQTDLVLPDVMPISLTRTYRPRDTRSRPFGIGATHFYEMFLVGDTRPWTYQELILPDGGRVRYNRISPGSGSFSDAVYENTSSPSIFYKSKINYNSNLGWDLTLRDGTVFSFPSADGSTNPAQGALIKIKDRYGNTITIARDSNFNITKITTQNGRYIDFTSDASNRITQARDHTGRTVNYIYDASGRLWKVTDAAGGVAEYTYDSSHRMLTIKDARGIVYLTNEYDANGRVTKQTQADSTTYLFAYTLDSNGKVTQTVVTDPRGNTRTVTFNSSGYTLTDTKGCCGGLARTFERQAGTSFVLSVTDPLNRRTAYTYDSMGNVTSVTRLAGTADAVTASATFEPIYNQATSFTDALNHMTTLGYDSKGNLTGITDPLSHTTTINYNSAGQPISITDPLNNTSQFTYDAGDMVAETNPLGQSATRFIDAAGRLVSITNSLGQTARYEYDALNRPTRVTDPLQGTTLFSYDVNGNLLSVSDARNNVTSYSYDNMDRETTRIDPLLRAKSYLYDANGNLQQVIDRKSQVTSYNYDTLDRLTLVTYQDGSTISYGYDSVNRLISITDSISGTITYTYDNLDRVLSETTSQGIVSYTYDAVGRRTSMAVPGQAMVSYTYDNANRLTQITQGASAVMFAYNAADRRTQLTLPNGVVTEYSYDGVSRLTALIYKKGGVTLGSLTYVYDAAGRISGVGGSFARTSMPQSVTTASYNAANHQTTFGSQTLNYDLNGNLTSDGANTYTWNARDQLVSMSGPGLTASFFYDASGRRISKSVNGATTGYLYDGSNIVQEQVSGTASANMLVGGIDEVFSRVDSTGTRSPITDHLGSAIALSDTAGVIQTEYTYEAFGKATASGATSSNQQKYTSREDDSTGLYYYRARYYSPSLQRFISEDPISFAGGDINLYGYVENDPISFIDPFGLEKNNAPWISEEAFTRALGVVGTFCAGFGDTITNVPFTDWSLTDAARDLTDANDAVDKNHGSYTAGEVTGYVWDAAMAGAGGAARRGYKVSFNYYPKAGGGGINVLKKGQRCFAIDWHRFKLKSTGNMVNRIHGHWGTTKSQLKKHRSLFTGNPM